MAKVVSVCVPSALARRIRVAGAVSDLSMTRKATLLVADWLRHPTEVQPSEAGSEQIKLSLTLAQNRALRVAAAEGSWDSASALARAVLNAQCPHEIEAVISSVENPS